MNNENTFATENLFDTCYNLLDFCNDLIDEIVFYSTTNQVPLEKDYTAFCKTYNELANKAKEVGIEL